MSEEFVDNAGPIQTQVVDGSTADLRDAVFNSAIDDRNTAPNDTNDYQPAEEAPVGDGNTEGGNLEQELPADVRSEFPENVKTVKDMIDYTRNLNRLKGKFSDKSSSLEQKIAELTQKFESMGAPKEQTQEEKDLAILEGLATKPADTIRELYRQETQKALQPVLEEMNQLRGKYESAQNRTTLEGFAKSNNLTDNDIMSLNKVMEQRMALYQGSAYFDSPDKILADAFDIVTAQRSRESSKVVEKRGNVVTRTNGGVRSEKKSGDVSREDVIAELGL